MQMRESARPRAGRSETPDALPKGEGLLGGDVRPRPSREPLSAADRLAAEKSRQFRTRRPAIVALAAAGLLAAIAVLASLGQAPPDPLPTGTIAPKAKEPKAKDPWSFDLRRERDAAEAMAP